ncbi:MAG TPA: hypothetical protein VMK82_09375, partial [Steroidobacteraceae bacterium]|nr:hypothetical protein [Steroidobacteraceae bacterium]
MLSKSNLAALRQCPRRLWLEHHAAHAAEPGNATTWRRARDGAIVGQKARELFGQTVLWPRAEATAEESVRAARDLLAANPTSPGVEVPLLRDHLFARADALIPAPGGYVLQETKSST